MARIGLLSDTHGFLDDAVKRYFENCNEVWHAGDIGDEKVIDELNFFKPCRMVYGNIDNHQVRLRTHEHLRFHVAGMDIWMTHIGGRPGNYANPIRDDLKNNPPKLFICGHSHICLIQYDKKHDMLYMNPGAAGKHGFHQLRTLIRFSIESGKVLDVEVIELGKRA
ncbi:MAG: metallophosphoesterase family protein [Flavobacteriales bacterium]